MTWEQQAADALRKAASDRSLRLSGHSGVSVRALLARADEIEGGAACCTDETYDGWTNRETWAVALHLDNNRDWYDTWRESLSEVDPADNIIRAADVLRDLVTEEMDALFDPAHRSDELIGIARDIGSLWRVNWTELGRAYLDRLSED